MSEQRGLENYASPILRAAVFRRLYPGAMVSYEIVPIEDAFPAGHQDYEGKAKEAIRCEIVLADGTWVIAHKEMDLVERGRAVVQTPEQLAKDETKALGRALRDLGIPQRLTELKELMRWVASMEGSAAPTASTTSPSESPIGSDGDNDDSADAGADDPTPEQILAQRFSRLTGAGKADVSKYARDELGVANVMRAGEHADALLGYLDLYVSGMAKAAEPEEEPF